MEEITQVKRRQNGTSLSSHIYLEQQQQQLFSHTNFGRETRDILRKKNKDTHTMRLF